MGEEILDWDDLCFDPHRSALEKGQSQGRQAGELAGFQDGMQLGQTKGIEFGMELGFIRGFLNVLDPTSVNDRVRKSMNELEKALDSFPSHDEVFGNLQDTPSSSNSLLNSGEENENDSEGNNDSEELPDDSTQKKSSQSGKVDVMAKMQRIRARMKLLTVQLGIPHYSLKQIMDAAATSSSSQPELPPIDNEW